MNRKYFIGLTLIAALAVAPTTWACGSPGQKTHVGKVMAVDMTKKSFTIFDVQTATPITFISDESMLKDLQDVRGMVQVKYEHAGDALKAIEVRY